MAKNRRSRCRLGVSSGPHQVTTNTVSSDESYPLPSARQSSDGAFSEPATASIHTTITSGVVTDDCTSEDGDVDGNDTEEQGEGEEEEEEDGDDDDDDDDEEEVEVQFRAEDSVMMDRDDVSTYAVSQYPRVARSFWTERPFLAASEGCGSSRAASTRSLWAQDLDYREIHGRRYCKEYHMPIDEMELMRQALVHQVFLHVLHDELTTVPLQDPSYVLDVGAGTGDWAIKLAETYPRTEVVGTDIAAVAETSSVPMNVFFEIEDAEDWDRPLDHYDLVHLRCMEGAFCDWGKVYGNVYGSLKPGGWVEVQDWDRCKATLDAFLRNFSPESPAHGLLEDLAAAAETAGRSLSMAHMDTQSLLSCGFVDVRLTEYVIPITVSASSVGKIWLISCLDMWEAMCLRLLTQEMGWDPHECKAACEETARELANMAKDPVKSRGLLVKMKCLVGRKPL